MLLIRCVLVLGCRVWVLWSPVSHWNYAPLTETAVTLSDVTETIRKLLQLPVKTLILRIVYVNYCTSQIYITEMVWPTLNGKRPCRPITCKPIQSSFSFSESSIVSVTSLKLTAVSVTSLNLTAVSVTSLKLRAVSVTSLKLTAVSVSVA